MSRYVSFCILTDFETAWTDLYFNLAGLFHSILFSFARRDCNRVVHAVAKYAIYVDLSTT